MDNDALNSKMKDVERQKYLDICKKRLTKIISTKIRTSFIGAIAAVEEELGFLWGQDKPEEERTEQERQIYELFQIARSRILDLGNSNIRAACNEIQNQTISWNRYQTQFIVKKD